MGSPQSCALSPPSTDDFRSRSPPGRPPRTLPDVCSTRVTSTQVRARLPRGPTTAPTSQKLNAKGRCLLGLSWSDPHALLTPGFLERTTR